MREVKEEVEGEEGEAGQSSDISPYHSDSDSAVMMSGNSPFISKVWISVWSTPPPLQLNVMLLYHVFPESGSHSYLFSVGYEK